MAARKRLIVSEMQEKNKARERLVVSSREPETRTASPASAPKITTDVSGEAWTRAAASQTKVPEKSTAKQTDSGTGAGWRTKTVKAAVGGSRGGGTAYRDVEMPTLAGRAADVISGAVKSTASNLSNMMTTLYQGGQKARSAENERTLADYQSSLERAKRDLAAMEAENREKPGTWDAAALQSQQYIVDDAQRKYDAMAKVLGGQVQEEATRQSHQVTDTLSESSAQDVARAKQGLGKGWQTVVDASVAGLQMGGDIALGAATGGGALLPMALRGFGGATQEARQEGATLGQQLAYGAGSAAVSVATEQLSNVVKPFAKAFGAGISDDLVEAAIGKAVERLAKTAAGKTALEGLLNTGVGFVGEGAEEFLEDVVNPILKRITYASNPYAADHFGQGNIDLTKRPEYLYEDGTIATVESASFNIDGKEVLLPTIWYKDGKPYHSRSDDETVQHYYDTGEYLGIFDTVDQADQYAKHLHNEQDRYYNLYKNAEFDLDEALYDFLIGGILGGLGGAVESGIGAKSTYQGYQTEVQNAAIDNAYDVMREKGMFSQEARQAVRDAEDIMPKLAQHTPAGSAEASSFGPRLDPGGNIAWGRMMEGVAPEKQAAFTEARQIADRFGADLVVDQLENGAAGEYRSGVITIDPTAADPVRQVLVHELTHHMETSGIYEDFSRKVLGFIAEDMGVDVDALRRSITQEYGQYGVALDEDGASRELVAKFAENYLFQDERSVQRLLQTDRNLFQKVYDWIRDTITKVRGTSEERFLIDAQRLYERALQSTGAQTGIDAARYAFSDSSVPDHVGAVELLRANLETLVDMAPVAEVRGGELPSAGKATERAMAFVDSFGGQVERPGFGTVLFSKGKIKNSLLGHGFGEAKIELLAGVPGVIQSGKQIGYVPNWKGRGYDSFVFAAPVTYKGDAVYVTAIVVRDTANRYYLHEAVDQNGNMLFGQSKSPDTASDGSRGMSRSTVAGTELSEKSISQQGTPVNEVSGDVMSKTGGQNSMGRSFDELVTNLRDGVEPGEAGQYTMRGFDAEPELRMPRAERSAEEIEMERRRAAEPTVEDLYERAGGRAEAEPESDAGARAPGQGALKALLGGDVIHGDLADYRGTDFLRGADQSKKDTARARRQAERRLQPSRGEKLFAKGIANGDYTVEDIPASMSRATVAELADYYAAENSYKGVDGVQERGREIRRKTEAMAEQYFKDDAGYKPISMLVMNERTPERVMRSIFGTEQGEKINEAYIYPVQQNEAAKMRFIQRQLDAVRTFEDSAGKRSALTKEERAIVQQMMEDRFVGETVASMEMAESIRNAAENIRNGEDAVDAAREFGLDSEERGLAQQLARWTENQELLEAGELDSVKINNAVRTYAEQYDRFYDAVNDFLTAHGYETIGFIKGYAPHMQGVDNQNKLMNALRAMGVNTDASSLPTSISGMTADYKPGKRWNPFFQSREGKNTDYDVAKGYESYVSYLGDILYHTDDIARLRGVSRYLRKNYGPEEINHAIDHAESLRYADLQTQTEVLKDAGKISDGTKLTYQDAKAMMDQYIDELYDNVTKVTKYGEFVKYIDNYANILAGKQSMADRGMEYMAGRTSLNAGNKLVAAFGRAQVAGNVSSVLNQSAQLSQILAEVDGKYVAQAALDLTKSTRGQLWNIKKTELFDQSDLLTGKKGIEYLTADDSKLDSLVTAMFKPADIMDGLMSALAVQSKYNQLVAEGKPSEVAMLEADRWATQIMASRMKGSRPLAFESKSVINQMVHLFQVEAMNSLEHLTQDLPTKYRQIGKQYGKGAEARAVAVVATKGLLSAFLLNRVAEAAYGGTPAPFDVLGYIANFVASGFGMSTNEALKRGLKPIINTVWEKLFGEALLDDDDEELQDFDWGSAASDMLYNVSNDVPILSNVSGLLGLGDQTMPLANMAEAAKGVGQAVTAEDRSAGEIGSAAMELGSTLLPGGRQVQKTYQGLQTMLNGGRVYGYGDKKRLQYTVEQTPDKWIQAVLFGNTGLSETRDFYASGESGLSAKQTGVVNFLVSEGADREAVYDAIQSIRKGEKTSGKLAALTEAEDLTDRQKWQLYANIITTEDTAKVGQFREMLVDGMSWQQISDVYMEYLRLDDVEGMAASEKATQFAAYLDRSGLNEEQIGEVKDALKFYSQIPAEAGQYEKLTGAGLTSSQAEGLTAAIVQLKPQAGKTSVSNLQRYRAVVDYGLSESVQMDTLRTMMEDAEYEKLETAYYAGLSPGQYVDFREATQNISSDKDYNGNSISGSKKAKVVAAIDAMPISSDQKTVLLYIYDSRYSMDGVVWSLTPGLYTESAAADSMQGVGKRRRIVISDVDDIMPRLVP